jgi:Asp-tRNA(Asn)/Glu-tRNA(Gln) amidotransferase A subunit family amidase
LLDSKAYLPEHTGPTQLYSVAEYHELYLSGKLTPTAVVKAILPLTQRDVANKSHHSTAWIKCFVEEATEAARLSTERYAAGKPLSIFDGVPTGLKDEANVQGHPTTYGRKYNASVFKIEEESSHAAQLFERAGAIILGKLK